MGAPIMCFVDSMRICYPQNSLSVLATETESSSVVALDVVRERGTFGQVTVSWQVTGDHNEGEVIPTSGEVRHYFH